MPVMWFDIQLCEFVRLVTVCSILQKNKQRPRDIKWLICPGSHNQEGAKNMAELSLFNVKILIQQCILFVSVWCKNVSSVSFPINKLFWVWLQRAHNLHFKHWTWSKASTEEGYHVNWHFLRIHDRVSINSNI